MSKFASWVEAPSKGEGEFEVLNRVFSGRAWLVLMGAFVLIALGSGLNMSFGVYLKPLLEAFDWSRSETSLAYSINMLVMGLFAFVAGALSDRFGARAIVLGGSIIYGMSLLLTSQVQNLWQLYLFYGFLMGLGRSAFDIPIVSYLVRWHSKNRGLAVGVAYAGTGVGMMVLSPLSRFLISAVGWRASYLLLALFFALLAFPAASLLKERREDGPLREREEGRPREGRGLLRARGSFPHRDRSFWLIAGTHFYDCVCHSVPLVHLVAFAMDRGVPKMEAAGLLGLIGLMGIVGRISVGAIADRIGARQALFLTLIVQTGMIPLLLLSQSLPMYYLLAVLLGLGWGGNGPMYPLLTRDYFGTRHIGATYGLLMVAGSLGMAAGGYGGGYLFDLSGSYHLSLLFSLVAGLVSIGFVLALRPSVEEPVRKPLPLVAAAEV